MRVLSPTLLATAILAIGAGTAQPAQAVEITKNMFVDPGSACQLSIPTIDTKVRPKATGYRNEGATNAFVICGATFFEDVGFDVDSLTFRLTAFDGATHDNVSCTAVNRLSGGGDEIYSTKLTSVGPSGASISWLPADLGGFAGLATSVTCNLPPGVMVTGLLEVIDADVGA